MGTVKKRIRSLVEGLIGHEVILFGPGSFALVRKQRRSGAWFSYRSQIRSVLERARVDLVLDVGANEGQFASGLRGEYAGEIASFEPVGSVFRTLKAAAAKDPLWNVHNLALGSAESTAVLHVSSQTKFSSFHKSSAYGTERFGRDTTTASEEAVTIRRLDDVLNENYPEIQNRRIFLKMDTQGHDMEVFRGAGDRLKNIVGIQSELSVIPIYDQIAHWTESILAYEEAGFGVVGLFPVSRDAEARVIEYDCLLVRAGSAR